MPPVITVKHPQYPIISPDGDGHATRSVSATRSTSRRTRSCACAGDQRRCSRTARSRPASSSGTASVGRAASARPPPGRYVLTVSAQDRAGNRRQGVSRSRSRRCGTSCSRGKRVVVAAGRPVRAARLDRRTDRPAGGCTAGRGVAAARDAAPARAEVAGRLPPVRLRRQATPRAPSVVVGVSAGAAQIAGALGALGLALLLVAPRRDLRVAGLVAWALGCAGLVVYLAPHGHHRLLAAAAVLGAIAAVGGTWVVAARAVAARARDARLRARAHSRCTSARPRRTCCCRSTASSRWRRSRSPGSSSATSERVARARAARVAARAVRRAGTGLSFLWSKDVRQGAIELLFFVLPFGLLAVVLARLRLVARLGARALRPARGDGARLRGDRDRPVRDAQHLLEPEGERRQRVRAERLVLPRQLGLLRPVDLRALPRRRDPREPRRRAAPPRRPALGGRRRADDRDHLGRAAAVVLAVELRRADGRRSSSRGGRLAAARASLLVGAVVVLARRGRASPQIRHRARRQARVALARDERALDARLERASRSPCTTR